MEYFVGNLSQFDAQGNQQSCIQSSSRENEKVKEHKKDQSDCL